MFEGMESNPERCASKKIYLHLTQFYQADHYEIATASEEVLSSSSCFVFPRDVSDHLRLLQKILLIQKELIYRFF